ncbi:threonine--tRNA ligase, mitochondrial 1-like isoform X2 [Prunus dulcis]|uniref:threonine--tRNA ligase, mitochondrial 1-like isoform X2 n=1 Tax=Prunus dulcis TaxID=3755 RepID=UPI0014830D28|nr:threonine--tRNA ligase, mitochondrial 1-like isoform X2 [Prunus dulcis]
MEFHSKDYLMVDIPKRNKLFESIQAEQRAARQSLPSFDPIRITLPDGKVKEGKKWITSPFEIASEISKSLASNALISEVNGVLWDMNRPLEGDAELRILTLDSFDNNEDVRHTFWHSSSHILGQALEMEYGCRLCIGPCARIETRLDLCTTSKEGFYYDAFHGDYGLNEEHFKKIESTAEMAIKGKQPFERIEVLREQALEMFCDNKFKVEIINGLPADKTITVYRCGHLVDLCRGPHIPNASFIKAFKCLKASAAYWRGNKDRESLQRVYGISYPDKKRLQTHMHKLEEAKKYDHRVLGKNQELFFFDPVSPGSCFFLPKGARIYNKLMEFIKNQYRERGYEEVISPNLYNMKLWETSGHAEKYKDNMFLVEIEKQEFGLKPMNCPGHCVMFQHRNRSYRELPLRMADFGVLHRNEASGALTGLTRVRRFQQMPESHMGDLATWKKAEAALKEALIEFGKPWEVNEGDGAFYGPKIDITVSDALNRDHQLATLQLDFQLPDRFKLYYSAEGEDGKMERPVMIHRAVLGSVERMLAVLLEHYKGKWPFWLSPRQAIVCPVSHTALPYALQVRDQLHQAGYYVDVDTSDKTIQKKVRQAQMAQYNYILVVGAEEVQNGQVSVRVRDKGDVTVMSMEGLLQHFDDQVEAFH